MSNTVRCSICHDLMDREKVPGLCIGTWNVCEDCWHKMQDYLTARGFTILQGEEPSSQFAEERQLEAFAGRIAKWRERTGGPWAPEDAPDFTLLNEIHNDGFEEAHALRPCGHSRGDYRDAGYIPGKAGTYTGSEKCVGCEREKAAMSRMNVRYCGHEAPVGKPCPICYPAILCEQCDKEITNKTYLCSECWNRVATRAASPATPADRWLAVAEDCALQGEDGNCSIAQAANADVHKALDEAGAPKCGGSIPRIRALAARLTPATVTGAAPPHPAQSALEHDRTKVAECVTAMKHTLRNYSWLLEGRGSYEWDDDRWHQEFKTATELLQKDLEPLAKIAADWSNCPKKWEDVQAARKDDNSHLTTLLTGLRGLRELGEKATPGPWKWCNHASSGKKSGILTIGMENPYVMCVREPGNEQAFADITEANADFIVACVNFVRDTLVRTVEGEK